MSPKSIRKASLWGVALAALALAPSIGGSASAQGVAAAPPAAALDPLERLLIQDDIRQRIILYALYADGDGPGGSNPRNLRKLADTLMTADVVSEIHLPAGGEPLIFTGRELVANTPPEVAPELAATVGGRHYMVGTVFDLVTPTVVKTRTPAVYFDATKNLHGPKCKAMGKDCGQKPVKTVMWVYEMTWVNTPDGWQISRNILRDDN